MLYSNLTALPVLGLRRELDRVFDDVFANADGSRLRWHPATDLREDATSYVVELELPGMSAEQVDVSAEKGVLTVSGERASSRSDEKNGEWRLTERVHGAFQRSFRLPDEIDHDGITATYTNGVLTVTVPKAAVAKAKKVVVKQQA